MMEEFIAINRLFYTLALIFGMIASPILCWVWTELFLKRLRVLGKDSWWHDIYSLVSVSLAIDAFAIGIISFARIWDVFDYYHGQYTLTSFLLITLVGGRYILCAGQIFLFRAVWLARHKRRSTQPVAEPAEETSDV